MRNSRRAAAFAVAAWLKTKDFPSRYLPDGPDRPFVQDLVYTTIRRLRPLRKVLGELVKKWPKGEMEALLYIGAAQVLYMDSVPDFAAVNETVEAAKACPGASVAKVVNGVLRNLLRRREELEAMVAASPADVRESFPSALCRRWVARYGAENAEKLMKFMNGSAKTYLARRDGSFAELGRGEKVEEVRGYAEGEFIVQDLATRHAVELVDPKPGEKILDACAAPGGKTIQMAWCGAEVVACEVNPKRRRRLEENIARAVVSDPHPVVVGAIPESGSFDKVLVDAPCSNTGVFGRRPDARWGWSEEKTKTLAALQSGILDSAARLVKSGGTLVYSTCSLEPEENGGQVAAFLARHPEFSAVAARESLPFETGEDGAFATSLVRA